MKLNRNSKLFINYFLGPLLFLWLSWSIYTQIQQQPHLDEAWQKIKASFNGPAIIQLIIVINLMIVNWMIEAIKWRLSVRHIQQVGLAKAFRAVLAGVSFSVSTPNRIGEYFGRVMYMDEGNRLRTISITVVGSISQVIITLLMGLLSLVFLQSQLFEHNLITPIWWRMIVAGTAVVLCGTLLLYFRLSWITRLIEKVPAMKRFIYLVEALEQLDGQLLIKLLILSTLRFFVFILQYFLVFQVFGVEISWINTFWTVSLSFLVMAAIPTIAIIELPLRGKTMTMLAGMFAAEQLLGIGFATATIWFINLVIPAVAGSFLVGAKGWKLKV